MPKKNVAFTFNTSLVSQANTHVFKTSPTLAAGDVLVFKDGGNGANITNLPAQIQTSGVLEVDLTATEMNADVIAVLFRDASGSEWQDQLWEIHTEPHDLDDVHELVDATALSVDTILLRIPLDLTSEGYIKASIEAQGITPDVNIVETGGVEYTEGAIPAAVAGAAGGLAIVGSEMGLNSGAAVVVTEEIGDYLNNEKLPNSVPVAGELPTIGQGILMLTRLLTEKVVVGAMLYVKEEDGTTTCMEFALNNPTRPTTITRTA